MRRSVVLLLLVLAVGLGAAGCQDRPSTPNDATTSRDGRPVGDGTSALAGGYRLSDVRLPASANRMGRISFRIVDAHGRPLTDFAGDQAERLHLYVVRQDLAAFRQLHPTMSADGTWSGRIDLSTPGPYRVLAQFVPGSARELTPVVLGRTVDVPGAWSRVSVGDVPVGSDGIIDVTASSVSAGPDRPLQLVVSEGEDGAVDLQTYLGAYAQVTAFDVRTGALVPVQPVAQPAAGPRGSTLSFRMSVARPGRYRFFVQVRVDGFVHTVDLTVPVTKPLS